MLCSSGNSDGPMFIRAKYYSRVNAQWLNVIRLCSVLDHDNCQVRKGRLQPRIVTSPQAALAQSWRFAGRLALVFRGLQTKGLK